MIALSLLVFMSVELFPPALSMKQECLWENTNLSNSHLSSNVYIYDYRLFENLYIEKFSDRKKAFFTTSKYGIHDPLGYLSHDYCKHSLDAIFIEDLKNGIIKNNTIPNSETIYVIPFMLGKNEFQRWYRYKMKSPNTKLEENILSVLNLFSYFNESKVNHFIMGDGWIVKGFKGMIRGRFEGNDEQSISVGYSTAKTLALKLDVKFCGFTNKAVLGTERPYKFSFVAALPHEVDGKAYSAKLSNGSFAHRTYFLESYLVSKNYHFKNWIWKGVSHFIFAAQKNKPKPYGIKHGYFGTNKEHRLELDETYDYLRKSLFTMNFHGDSPTTDRIFNAIDTATIVMALTRDRDGLIKTLPFRQAIDWDSFFLWVNTTEFEIHPLRAVVNLIKNTSTEEILRRQRLIFEMQEDLSLWKNPVGVYENLWGSVRRAMDEINCRTTQQSTTQNQRT